MRTCSACAHAPLSDQRETLVGLPVDAAEPVFCPHIKQVYGSVGFVFWWLVWQFCRQHSTLLFNGPRKWEVCWDCKGTDRVREASAWLSGVGPLSEMRYKALPGIV